jgi:hypothetical protein
MNKRIERFPKPLPFFAQVSPAGLQQLTAPALFIFWSVLIAVRFQI